MSENRFNTTAFANFSTKMDQNIALTNDHASLTLAKFLRECFGYRTAVVRFECTDNEAIPLAHCISIDFPELERENSLFLNDPFCNYILDNFSEQKFFAASDICPDYLNSTLIQTIDYKTPIFVGAFGYSDVWRQILVVLFFKPDKDFIESERFNFSLLYDMLAAKCGIRDRFVEAETLRFMKNAVFDSNSIGTVIVTDNFEIVDSNLIFETYYRPKLHNGNAEQFLRSLLNVYNATDSDENNSTTVSTLQIGCYIITIRSEKNPLACLEVRVIIL